MGLSSVEEKEANRVNLVSAIRSHLIGRKMFFNGPFGPRPLTYCDYIASGRALTFIEDFIRHEVLPWYGNTHSTNTMTAQWTTSLREEARDLIRRAVNASPRDDSVIFSGSGCTGAINKLVHILNPMFKTKSPVVFVSIMEHHSNLLPWREVEGVHMVTIKEDEYGRIDLDHLRSRLEMFSREENTLIGCFCAASNVTGIINDDLGITELLHEYGALAFWDYAAAAPYVNIDMNPQQEQKKKLHEIQQQKLFNIGLKLKKVTRETGKIKIEINLSGPSYGDNSSSSNDLLAKDAIYFSMHKFVGGVQTPGVLVAKHKLFANPVPHDVGGGTVLFVTDTNHIYLEQPEEREEGGTPAIVESIRAGLTIQLKEAVTADYIMNREEDLMVMAKKRLQRMNNLVLLGNPDLPRLPIISFMIRHPESGSGFLHHNFVSTLLSDLFGIEARGGCACAGPYGQQLLGISGELAQQYLAAKDFAILKPGFARLNLSWFAEESEIEFVLEALEVVAEKGWMMLPQYRFNRNTGACRHFNRDFEEKGPRLLENVTFMSGKFNYKKHGKIGRRSSELSYGNVMKEIRRVLEEAKDEAMLQHFSEECGFDKNPLRWFLLPSEAQTLLRGDKMNLLLKAPFEPKHYRPLPANIKVRTGSLRSKKETKDTSDSMCSFTTKLANMFDSNLSSYSKKTLLSKQQFEKDDPRGAASMEVAFAHTG